MQRAMFPPLPVLPHGRLFFQYDGASAGSVYPFLASCLVKMAFPVTVVFFPKSPLVSFSPMSARRMCSFLFPILCYKEKSFVFHLQPLDRFQDRSAFFVPIYPCWHWRKFPDLPSILGILSLTFSFSHFSPFFLASTYAKSVVFPSEPPLPPLFFPPLTNLIPAHQEVTSPFRPPPPPVLFPRN